MKQRVISAIIGISLIILIFPFYKTLVLNVAIAVINGLCVYELSTVTKNKNPGMFLVCLLFAVAVPFLGCLNSGLAWVIVIFTFFLAFFIILLAGYKTTEVASSMLMALMTTLVSLSFTCFILLRDTFSGGDSLPEEGLFYICLVFLGAWITDAGAYFIGTKFGKKKLCPVISPKKTVEGAVGGVFVTIALFYIAAAVYSSFLHGMAVAHTFNFVLLTLLSVLSAVLSIIGDLTASVVKRVYSAKDYGKIIPGQGGILDRFDSIIFVAPFVFIFSQFFSVVLR